MLRSSYTSDNSNTCTKFLNTSYYGFKLKIKQQWMSNIADLKYQCTKTLLELFPQPKLRP